MQFRTRPLLTIASILSSVMLMPAWAAPPVFWVSDTVRPDNTVLVTGARLDSIRSVEVVRLGDGADSADGAPVQAKILSATGHSLKFVVPATIEDGVFRFALIDKDGSQTTRLLNAPTVYWVQGDSGTEATPGGWLRVLGRNIFRSEAATATLKGEDGAVVTLRPRRGNLWDAAFDLPQDLAPGTYRVAISNGSGGEAATSDAGVLNVIRLPEAPTLRVNVHDLGAKGDDKQDDSGAIQAAIDQVAAQGGGTVYLPRGNYNVTRPLVVAPQVILKGENRDLVNLVWPDFDTPPLSLISGFSDFAVEDMTLIATNHAHIISGGFAADDGGEDGRNIAIRRVTVRASAYRGHISTSAAGARLNAASKLSTGGGDTVRLAGSNLTIEDCDVLGSGRSLYLLRPRGAHVARNIFYNGRLGWYSITGASGVILEDNSIRGADLQSTGGGINTLARGWPVSENALFYHNTFERFLGWDREALTSDGGGGYFYGNAVATGTDTLALDPNAPAAQKFRAQADLDWTGAALFVLAGDGVGSFAQITTRDGSAVKLDRPLAIAPGGQATVSIVPLQRRYLIVENQFTDASFAVQFFGTSLESIVYGNKSIRTGGFINRGMNYLRGMQPAWYNQFIGNEILVGNAGRTALVGMWATDTPPDGGFLNYGSIVRGNTLDGNARIDLRGSAKKASGLSTAVIENNEVRNTDIGITVDPGSRDVLLRGNRFESVADPVRVTGAKANCEGSTCRIK